MVLKKEIKYDLKFDNLILRKAQLDDVPIVARMDSLIFNLNLKDDEPAIIENINNGYTYISELNNEIIGKIRFEKIESIGSIYGFEENYVMDYYKIIK